MKEQHIISQAENIAAQVDFARVCRLTHQFDQAEARADEFRSARLQKLRDYLASLLLEEEILAASLAPDAAEYTDEGVDPDWSDQQKEQDSADYWIDPGLFSSGSQSGCF